MPPQSLTHDDETLRRVITLASGGDLTAFAELYDATAEDAIQLFRSRRRSDDLEAVLEEAYMRLWTTLCREQGAGNCRQWVLAVLGSVDDETASPDSSDQTETVGLGLAPRR